MSRSPDPLHARLGRVIRMHRILKGHTQNSLAQRVGIRFQQLQKYENGSNRVTAVRLFHIAKALGVDISEFFEALEGEDKTVFPDLPGADGINNKSSGSRK